jgi:hypothetical protein
VPLQKSLKKLLMHTLLIRRLFNFRWRTELYRFIKSEHRFINRASETDIVKEYKQLSTQIKAAKTSLWRDSREEYKKDYYFYHIHNEEMERKL